MNTEIWHNIPELEGYQASSFGRIRSERKIRKPNLTRKGYLRVKIRGRCYYVHRLILRAFVGDSQLDVNHKDGNKLDNRLDNLEYVSGSENMRHAFRTGLQTQVGEDNANAKLTELDVTRIRELYQTRVYSQCTLANMFGIGRPHIGRIVNHKRWAHIPGH
jgi:HNH endonuclease/NUMOD4 motif